MSPLRILVLLLVSAALLLAQGCAARPLYEGEVVGISDGDTVRVLDAGHRVHKVRLAWIDAPERDMPFGQVARQALAQRIFRRQVSVEVMDKDRYGREVAVIRLDGVDINLQQLSDGFAWHYQHYARKGQTSAEFDRYAAAQGEARAAGRGLWRDAAPQPPWDWRHQRRRNGAAE